MENNNIKYSIYLYMDDYNNKYLKYKNKYLKIKKIISNLKDHKTNIMLGGGDNNMVDLILFKAEWCGHCKRFLPIWNTIQAEQKYKNKVNFITFDSEKDVDKIKDWNVEGFPTLMIVKNGVAKEYQGPREMQDMLDLLDTFN